MKSKIFIICFMIVCLPLCSQASETLVIPEYTEEYQNWLELSEEEKKNFIEPQAYELTTENQMQVFSLEENANQSVNSTLPSQYTKEYYGNVKDQGGTWACWAYSAATIFDTNYAMTNLIRKTFSNLHMYYRISKKYGFNREVDSGGNMQMALAYATNGIGIALDSNNITVDTAKDVQAVAKVSDYVILSSREQIKNHIYRYAPVFSSTYLGEYEYFSTPSYRECLRNDNLAYCCDNLNQLADHAITLIGWDDEYEHPDFPRKKGAYLALNSYGAEFANNGTYHIFYDDVFVNHNLYGVKRTDDMDYDYLYQHDEFGYVFPTGNEQGTYLANVFTRKESKFEEKLKQISIYAPSIGEIKIYINANGSDVKTSSATQSFTAQITEPGYHTINLDQPVVLKNNQFSVGVKYPGFAGTEKATTSGWTATVTSNLGESYLSLDGENYTDMKTMYAEPINACIKAFTDKGQEINEDNSGNQGNPADKDDPIVSNKKCTIKVSKNITSGGNVSGGKTVTVGTKVTVKAMPNVGYRFLGWYKGDNVLSKNASYTLTATENLNLVAKFEYFENISNYIFDYQYYADHNLDVYRAFGYNEMALRNHWEQYGKTEGRACSSILDLKYYVANNKDLAIYKNNYVAAYNHFVNYGCAEYRKSSAEYDANYYKKNHSDLKNMTSTQLIKHYALYGKNELRQASTNYDITSFLFDADIYAYCNPDVVNAYGYNENLLKMHWYTYGINEGRIASLVFDAKYYLKNYPDIANSSKNYKAAYQHFIKTGFAQGRQGSSVFSIKYYLSKNNDIKRTYKNNYLKSLKHFVTYGKNEPRKTSEQFNVNVYRDKNNDLKRAYKTNYIDFYKHYLRYGKNEKRVCK